jgi:hypothetical protein
MAPRGRRMKDVSAQLRFATRRAKSDVANKLVSMFLHELSRRISRDWEIKIDSEKYEEAVREAFQNRCPYCLRELLAGDAVIEHLDGMNRYRAGLHVPGNVLVACKRCNNEKRRDDSLQTLSLATTGWESFLSHDGSKCAPSCMTCLYWKRTWEDDRKRTTILAENLSRIRLFRGKFPEFQAIIPSLAEALPGALTKLYSDCQIFAESEIKSLLEKIAAVGMPEA